jgi:phage tail-like protein
MGRRRARLNRQNRGSRLWFDAVTGPGKIAAIMAEFTVNPQRFDPYKNFKFRVKWDGKYVPGISKVSPLRRTTGVLLYRDGGSQSLDRRSPGLTAYEPITLERGRTHDTAFEDWADLVWSLNALPGAEVALKTFRKDITIEFRNEAGQVAMAFKVYRCWPSHYSALSELDANAEAVARETIVLEHEGWERDTTVKEPSEPS